MRTLCSESQSITEQLFGGEDFAKMVDDLTKANYNNRIVSNVVANPNRGRGSERGFAAF